MNKVDKTVSDFSDFLIALGLNPEGLQPRLNENKKLFFDNQEHQEKYEIFINIYKSGFIEGRQSGIDSCLKQIGQLIAKS